ncbi:MAG: 16S rRNA (guanine(527)-N(7))-methyltransferase RsmG [Eubacteriales bacterium]
MNPNSPAFRSELARVFSLCGLSKLLSFDRTEQFVALTERLLTENQKYNLTAITEPEQIILQHYADSLSLAALLPAGASLVDVGTGAGFPALPLAICRPDLRITAIDSTERRVSYVAETAAMLGLSHLTARTLRAEAAGRDDGLRERFDVAVARGVSELRVLCEYCLPLVRVGGVFLAMKGRQAAQESTAAKKAVALLGGKLRESVAVPLTDGHGEPLAHVVVVIDKLNKTPPAYPRDNAQIVKRPL